MEAAIATQPTTKASAASDTGERNVGRIEEIQGVVIEAVFNERLPEINHAITVRRPRRNGLPPSLSDLAQLTAASEVTPMRNRPTGG